jgi:hypothetical protein
MKQFSSNELFEREQPKKEELNERSNEEKPKVKSRPKKDTKPKKESKSKIADKQGQQLLYCAFSTQEIMEFFDWGFLFPVGYFYDLLGENDVVARFENIEKRYFTQFQKGLYDNNDRYLLEFDQSEIDIFLKQERDIYYSELPIPVAFVKKVHCKDSEKQLIFQRLWTKTDNDSIEITVSEYVAEHTQPLSMSTNMEPNPVILENIKHIDRCLGAICFIRDLDPFIIAVYKGNPNVGDYSNTTISQKFLALLQGYMTETQKQEFISLTGSSDIHAKYCEFISKMIAKDWDSDQKNGILLKAISGQKTYENIINTALDLNFGSEDTQGVEKLKSTIRSLSVGLKNIRQLVADEEELKKSFNLFLLLLSLHPRRSKIETDPTSFRSFLFDNQVVSNPKQIDLLGTIYGYYLGYHNLRKHETIRELAGFDITSEPRIFEAFRIKLSPADSFEKMAFLLIYNKLASESNILPKVKVSLEELKSTSKKQNPNISVEKNRKVIKFIHIPSLGGHGYTVDIETLAQKQQILSRAVVSRLGDTLKRAQSNQTFNTVSYILLANLFDKHRIPSQLISDVKFRFQNRDCHIELDVDIDLLIARVDSHIRTSQNEEFVHSLSSITDMLEKLVNLTR